MYSIQEREDITQQLKSGRGISELNKMTGIPEEVIYAWKQEIPTIDRINALMQNEEYEEAKRLVQELQEDDDEIIRMKFFADIAQLEGNIELEKEFLEKRLALDPKDVKAMSGLIRIARQEEDTAREKGDTEGVEKTLAIQKKLGERQLQINPNDVVAMSVLIRIAREEEDTAREEKNTEKVEEALARQKELAEKQLQINPEDMVAMSVLIRIAREEEDTARRERKIELVKRALAIQKRLAERQLKLEPKNPICLSVLARIAREDDDVKREKELLSRLLKRQPDNVEAISSLIRIARIEGDLEEEKRLLNRRLELEPDNAKSISSLIRIAKIEENIQRVIELLEELVHLEPDNLVTKRELECALAEANNPHQSYGKPRSSYSRQLPKTTECEINKKLMYEIEEKEETPISEARKLIYEGKDIMHASEDIRRLLEGENETDRIIVIAELYYHTGLIDRANKQLKAYKRTLDPTTQSEDIQAINEALRIVQTKRTVGFEWNEFWNKREATTVQGNQDGILADQTQISTDDGER